MPGIKSMSMFSFTHNNVTYTICIPDYPVNLFVDHYLIMKGNGARNRERLFPNNKAEIFFNLGDTVQGISNSNNPAPYLNNSIISGVRSSFFDYISPANFFMAGMRFTLFGFNQIFNIPANHFTNNHFAAEDIWGNEIQLLLQRLHEVADCNNKLLHILNEWITHRLSHLSLSDIKQWHNLEKKFELQETSISEMLNRHVGYSHKHAIQLIKTNCGMPPKYIQKIIRFNEALQMISVSSFKNWCQVAYDTGYADQSHFIRNFKKFSGYTPAEYVQLKPIEYRRKEAESA